MDEKETTPEVKTEGEQPKAEVKPQPTVEELNAEIARKENVIQQLKKDIKDIQKHGGSKAEIEGLARKIDGLQDWVAGTMDDLAARISGETPEVQTRKSYKAMLDENRKNQPQPQVDPAAQRFLDYLADEGLTLDDDMVMETIRDTKTPQEAMKAMKEKIKTMNQAEIEKLAEKKAEEKMQTAIEQALKNAGLTSAGVGSPSGGGKNWTKKQLADMSVEDYLKVKPEIDEALRQGRIKDQENLNGLQ